MKVVFAKATVAILAAALTPVMLFFMIGVVLMRSVVGLPELFARLVEFLQNVAFWGFISLILPLPISFAHALFLGFPAFIIGWRLRAIHWRSVLITSFFIGALPVFVFSFVGNFALPSGLDLITIIGIILIGSIPIFIIAGIFGLFGVSGGLAFWFIWRYWASPESPAGQSLSLSVEQQSETLNVNSAYR